MGVTKDNFLNFINAGKQDILNFCEQKEYIFLYGAGQFGEHFQQFLSRIGVEISGYIISDDQDLPQGKAFPVYHLSELPFSSGECGIFLTLDRDYHAEILQQLSSKGLDAVYPKNLGSDGNQKTTFMAGVQSLTDPHFYSTFTQLLKENHSGVESPILDFGCLKLPNFTLENPNFADLIMVESFDIALPGSNIDGGRDFLVEGPYEFGEIKIAPNDTVLDCGANVGMFSAYAAQKLSFKEGAVYAFEPIESIRKLLEKTQMLYPDKIKVMPYAVSDKVGTTYFWVNGYSSTATYSESQSDLKVEVHTTSLDAFVKENQINKVDFIKVDIEGAERQMLAGAQDVLKYMEPKLSVCTYHLPDDKEVLEQLIMEANPKYKVEHHWKKLYAYVPK